MAYEAATADIGDFNLIDHFHLDAYDERTVNYNRDVEAFPVLKRIIEKITETDSFYRSPTDMGVNRAGYGIVDDERVREAACQEIIRRYFRYACEYALGLVESDTVQRVQLLMEDLGLREQDRPVVVSARDAASEAKETGKGHDGIFCGAALELRDGRIVNGKNSPLLHAASALLLNAGKVLAGIPDSIHLLPESIVNSVGRFKKRILRGRDVSLDLEETMIALSISATMNPAAQTAIDRITELAGCEVHLSHMPTAGDEAGLRKLGVNLTSDPLFAARGLLFEGS